MRPDHVRLGVLAAAILFVFPCSTFAQTNTSTDAAIAKLRQLLADQRTALDRQARTIEEGRRLATLQERVEGTNRSAEERLALDVLTPTAAAAVGTQAAVSQQPTSRTAAEPTPDLPAMVVSAGDFPGSIRIPGTESSIKLGGQARMVARQQEWRPRIVESDSGRLDAQVLTRGRALSRLKTLEGKRRA